MHYYKFNIGDYKSHTGHLDPLEDIAYRRMLDWQYLHEKPLPLDIAYIGKAIGMRSHSECIEFVLQEFYEETSEGYINPRVQREIEDFQEKSEKASKSAKARWSKRKESGENANALPTQSEGNANHKPLTNTVTNVTDASASEFDLFRVWREYLTSAGLSPDKGCSLLGKVIKQHGEDKARESVLAVIQKKPADPLSYLQAVAKPKKRGFVC